MTVLAIKETLLNSGSATEYQNYLSNVFLDGGKSVETPATSADFASANVRTSSATGSTELTGLGPDEMYLVAVVATQPDSNSLPVFATYESVTLQAGANEVPLSIKTDVAGTIESISEQYGIDMTANLLSDLDLSGQITVLPIEESNSAIVLIQSAYDPQDPPQTIDIMWFQITFPESCAALLDCTGDGTVYAFPGSGSEIPQGGDISQFFVLKGLPFEQDPVNDQAYGTAEQVAFAIPTSAESGFEDELDHDYETISVASLTFLELDSETELPLHDVSWSMTFENQARTTISGELTAANTVVPEFSEPIIDEF